MDLSRSDSSVQMQRHHSDEPAGRDGSPHLRLHGGPRGTDRLAAVRRHAATNPRHCQMARQLCEKQVARAHGERPQTDLGRVSPMLVKGEIETRGSHDLSVTDQSVAGALPPGVRALRVRRDNVISSRVRSAATASRWGRVGIAGPLRRCKVAGPGYDAGRSSTGMRAMASKRRCCCRNGHQS